MKRNGRKKESNENQTKTVTDRDSILTLSSRGKFAELSISNEEPLRIQSEDFLNMIILARER